MRNKSAIEEILEMAVKSPAAGIVFSVIFAGLGLYLTNKQAPEGAKPAETLVLPMMHLFGTISYFISAVVLLAAGIGFVVSYIKRGKHKSSVETRTYKDMIDPSKDSVSPPTPASNVPRFKTKEEYFRWKESAIKKSSDKGSVASLKGEQVDIIDRYYQMETTDKEQTEGSAIKSEGAAWTVNSIFDALGKIDWYQFEKFSAALLRNEGYVVERKGGAHPDGGVDLIATKDNETILVQCKHWKTWDIKPKTVREMIGTMMINQTSKGAIYTLKGATRAAQKLATQQAVRIEDGYSLADRALRQLTKEELDRILNANMHHCPICEAEMIWRQGLKFKPFWGCSRYPTHGCRGKLKYTGAR